MKKIKSYCEVKKAEKASKTAKKKAEKASKTAKKKVNQKNVGLYKVEINIPVSFLAYGSEDEIKKRDCTDYYDITESFYSHMYEALNNLRNAKLIKITKTSQINSDKNLANVDSYTIPITDSGAEKILELIKETDIESMKKKFDPLDYVTPEDVWNYDGGIDVETIVCLNKIC
jgi:hypothetical protein